MSPRAQGHCVCQVVARPLDVELGDVTNVGQPPAMVTVTVAQ